MSLPSELADKAEEITVVVDRDLDGLSKTGYALGTDMRALSSVPWKVEVLF